MCTDFFFFNKVEVIVILNLFILKVRCLEFVLGDAIKQGCTSIVTCGPALSNSMRALAVMAASLGLTAHLLVKNDKVIKCSTKFPKSSFKDPYLNMRIF